jgi:hypothetical protein
VILKIARAKSSQGPSAASRGTPPFAARVDAVEHTPGLHGTKFNAKKHGTIVVLSGRWEYGVVLPASEIAIGGWVALSCSVAKPGVRFAWIKPQQT